MRKMLIVSIILTTVPLINAFSDRLFINVINTTYSPVRYQISNSHVIRSSFPSGTLMPGVGRTVVLMTNHPCFEFNCNAKLTFWRVAYPHESYSLKIKDHTSYGPPWSLVGQTNQRLNVTHSGKTDPEYYNNSTVTFSVNNPY
jgi:hypothetical protein